jgi:hypothetical protein
MHFKETVLCKLSLHKYLNLIVPDGLKCLVRSCKNGLKIKVSFFLYDSQDFCRTEPCRWRVVKSREKELPVSLGTGRKPTSRTEAQSVNRLKNLCTTCVCDMNCWISRLKTQWLPYWPLAWSFLQPLLTLYWHVSYKTSEPPVMKTYCVFSVRCEVKL